MLKALLKKIRSLGGNSKLNSQPFFSKVERSTKFCFVASRRLSSGMELVQACILQQVWPRPNLDGNKQAKVMCLARKARDREVFI